MVFRRKFRILVRARKCGLVRVTHLGGFHGLAPAQPAYPVLAVSRFNLGESHRRELREHLLAVTPTLDLPVDVVFRDGGKLGANAFALSGATTDLLLAVPFTFTDLAWSWQFEQEADDYALEYLRWRQLSPQHFVDIMKRLECSQRINGDVQSSPDSFRVCLESQVWTEDAERLETRPCQGRIV